MSTPRSSCGQALNARRSRAGPPRGPPRGTADGRQRGLHRAQRRLDPRRSGDGRDDLLVARPLGVERPVVAAVPQHLDPVGHRADVGHVVADEDDAQADVAQPFDVRQHLGRLHHGQRRRRLVEQHQPRLPDEGAGDGDSLPLPGGQVRQRRPDRRDATGQLVEHLAGDLLHPRVVPREHAVHLAAEEQVGRHVEVLAQRQVLEHRRDAKIVRRGRRRHRDCLARHLDQPRVGLEHAGDDLGERRLARAVVADEGDHLVRVHVEVDADQRLDRAEPLGDAAHRQQWNPCRVHRQRTRSPSNT